MFSPTAPLSPGDYIEFDDEVWLVEGLLIPHRTPGGTPAEELPRPPMLRLRGEYGVLTLAAAQVSGPGFRKLKERPSASEAGLPAAAAPEISPLGLVGERNREVVEADRGAVWDCLPEREQARILRLEDSHPPLPRSG